MEDYFVQIGTRLERLEAGYQEIREDLDMVLEMIQDKPASSKVRKLSKKPSGSGKKPRMGKPYDRKGCFKCRAKNHWKRDCPN